MAKTILITGCSSGIGLATAKKCKEAGLRVFATARAKEDLQKLREIGFEAFRLELKDPDSIDTTVRKILERSHIDILFNNAAYGQPGALEDLSLEALQEQFSVNLFGWHYLTRRLIPHMRRRSSGLIVQHSSILGLVALRYRGAYNASKFALEGYTDTLRLELAGSGIKVVTINTGPVTSNFRSNALRHFLRHIDIDKSFHKAAYEEELERLQSQKKVPFTLSSEEAARIILAILLHPDPKPRYYITKASVILASLKRILPTALLDRVLLKI